MPRRGRILIVEDDNAMAQMCAKLLQRQGHSVVIAGSSQDALAIVRSGIEVDVVLSDVHMPAMNGWDLARALHDSTSDLPVILMSGRDDRPVGAHRCGVCDYLTKPFDSHALVDSVQQALGSVSEPVQV